jgi:hypothetical protein
MGKVAVPVCDDTMLGGLYSEKDRVELELLEREE